MIDREKEREREREEREIERHGMIKRRSRVMRERRDSENWIKRKFKRFHDEQNNKALFYYLEYLNAWKYLQRTKAKKYQLITLHLDIFARI